MRKALVLFCACVTFMATPNPAWAWGYTGHRLIMRRAIQLLPPELKAFFERYQDEIIVRVVDPDLWRNVGWEDDPNHFVDFGMPELGPYPFAGLPRERDKAIEKFGARVMDRVDVRVAVEQHLERDGARVGDRPRRRRCERQARLEPFDEIALETRMDAAVPCQLTVEVVARVERLMGVLHVMRSDRRKQRDVGGGVR